MLELHSEKGYCAHMGFGYNVHGNLSQLRACDKNLIGEAHYDAETVYDHAVLSRSGC